MSLPFARLAKPGESHHVWVSGIKENKEKVSYVLHPSPTWEASLEYLRKIGSEYIGRITKAKAERTLLAVREYGKKYRETLRRINGKKRRSLFR